MRLPGNGSLWLTLGLLLLSLAVPRPAQAQYTFGRVQGTVLDSSGASISGTQVQLLHVETNSSRSFTTGPDGFYVFFAVPPGTYRITAGAPRFASKSVDVSVSTNQTVTANLSLRISSETTNIEVKAEAPGLLDSTDAQHSHTLTAQELARLPNLSRNMITTVTLAAGVQPTNNPRGGSTFGGGVPGFAVTLGIQSGLISANGGRAYASSVQLDYTDANDWELGGFAPPMQAITPDLLEEFKLLTSNFPAEYGVKANAQVIMVTKSGTNRWHGTGYDFLQNDMFNARDYLDTSGEASKLKQNIYGFTMGGPLVKNRTFFFGGWEGRKTRGASLTQQANLPTEQARSQATDPISANLLDLYVPVPASNSGELVTVAEQIPSPVNNYQFLLKVDHQFSDAHVLAARYVQGTASFVARFPSRNQLPGFDGDDQFALRNVNLTDSYSLSSRTVNELRLAYGYDRATVGTQNGLVTPRFQILGVVNFGALETLPTNRTFNLYQVNDILNLMRGSHVLKVGVDARKIEDNSLRDTNSRGVFTFAGQDPVASLNLFLAGQPTNWTELFGSTQRAFRTGLYGLFVQDDWKVAPGLTLNLGLRWDLQAALSEAHGLTSVLDPNTPGDIGAAGSGPLGTFRVGGPAVNNNLVLPAPRLGFAWNPHQGNFVLRGGYGIYWDSFTFDPLSESRFAPPWNYNLTLSGAQISGANSFDNLYLGTAPILAQGAAQVGSFGQLQNFGSVTTVDPNLRNAYVQQFTLGVEYRLRSYVISLGYIGTKGTDLTKLVPINPVVNGPAPATSLADEQARLSEFRSAFAHENGVGNLRLDPRFDQVNLHTSTGSSIYHSLQAEVRKSFSHGLQFQAAYTWSRAIDDASDFNPSILANDSSFPQMESNPAAERAVSDFDIAHRIVITSIWQVPFFHHLQGAAGKILDGWSFESSNLWQTGLPATLLAGPRLGILDVNLDGNTVRAGSGLEDNTRANCSPAGVHFTLGDPASVSGISQPLLGNNGTCGRNSIRMLGLTNFDWALSKDFRLAESGPLGSGPWNLQFRTEAFNIFNTPFLTATGDAWRTASNLLRPPFANINNAGSTRKVQFALKLIW